MDDPTPLEDEIFGASSSSDGELVHKEDDDGEELGEEVVEEEYVQDDDNKKASDKIMEARREFDEALEKIKNTGNRRQNAFDFGVPVVKYNNLIIFMPL